MINPELKKQIFNILKVALAAAAATFLAKLLEGLQTVDITTYLPAVAAILAYGKFVK